jgi:hypothetical protein
MNLEQQLIYSNKEYRIISTEQEFIIHPIAIGLLPMTKTSLQYSFSSLFHIQDFQLMLNNLVINDQETEERYYEFDHCKVSYNGAILIGADLVKEYNQKSGKLSCFSYQKVFELVFEDGILITAIDQSKAMSRIRKNLELGLRSLSKSRDLRCINRFISSSFVGDYKAFRIPHSRLKYLEDMKKDYSGTKFSINK